MKSGHQSFSEQLAAWHWLSVRIRSTDLGLSKSLRILPINEMAVKSMSTRHEIAMIFLAASIISIPALAEENYSVKLASDKFLGNYLVNQSGFALYYFLDDSNADGASACYDDCASKWPPFFAGTIIVPDRLRSADFATIARTDGSDQTTFKGWPLYLCSLDKDAGDVYGEGREDNRWHVVNPQDQPQLF